MKEARHDVVIIGAGCAGMTAATEIAEAGWSCLLIDREEILGGVLGQCIHNGFGLHEYDEDLTGPEFAERQATRLQAGSTSIQLGTTVQLFRPTNGGDIELFCASSSTGVSRVLSRALVLAMGCRERNRGNVRIPGSRPAGIFTAGLAQRLVNIEGYIPGRNIVIIGSGDIGLIMARRLSWIGCSVKAVVEIMPYPSGLARNIVQCLNDFNIPLYLSCQTTRIFGLDRVEAVEVTPMVNAVPQPDQAFQIACDTVLLSVGLIPENELSKEAGVLLNPMTGGPLIDAALMTNLEGVFACGNVLHVHDLADSAVQEARTAGRRVAEYLAGIRPVFQVRVKAGANVRYINPSRLDPNRDNRLYLRSLIVKNEAVLEIHSNQRLIFSKSYAHIQPSEMINLKLSPKVLSGLDADSLIEISLR